MQIHQLVPALHNGDAIGDSARMMRDFLRRQGYDSDIYAYDVDDSISEEAIRFHQSQPATTANDVLILHYALPSGMTPFLQNAPAKKALIYHNITPADFWLPYQSSLVHLAFSARKELARLSRTVHRSAGDSEYNRLELDHLNFSDTCVLPIYVDQSRYDILPSQAVLHRMRDEYSNFLCVGRVAPNKKLEDVLRLCFFYRKMYSPLSRVIFVGKTSVAPTYYAAVKALSSRYGFLPDDVLFTGHVDWSELVAYYHSSHLLVSMSEHEGFCVPLVEAMICRTPVLAYAKTAVPFTLGEAGVQFVQKDYPTLAGICNRIINDVQFRSSILETQNEQLRRYSRAEIERSILEFLAPLL